MSRQTIDSPQTIVLGRAAMVGRRAPYARRSQMELQVEVLHAIYRGRDSPSRIVYAANLSYDRVLKCIRFLEERSLIAKRRASKEAQDTALQRRGQRS
ncbi:winged helix-turn-helix domain-containing protein [Candidatus Bathyarchaeota archaeon]|nr:winged helix-turn-helix domain-containing protein [Candidatus Bathyarchaeota archaeon]